MAFYCSSAHACAARVWVCACACVRACVRACFCLSVRLSVCLLTLVLFAPYYCAIQATKRPIKVSNGGCAHGDFAKTSVSEIEK